MPLSPSTIEPQDLRRTFGHYPSGVAAVAAQVDDSELVLVSSSFTVGVSLDPPLVMLAVQHTSQSWTKLREAPSLGVSILSNQQGNLCRQLSGGDRRQRFSNVAVEKSESGAIFLGDASVWLECSIFAEHPAGDHNVVILQVHTQQVDHDLDPLVFHSSKFRSLG